MLQRFHVFLDKQGNRVIIYNIYIFCQAFMSGMVESLPCFTQHFDIYYKRMLPRLKHVNVPRNIV